MELKTVLEAIFTSNIHTGEKTFYSCYLQWFMSRFFPDKVTNLVVYFGLN